MVMAVIMLSAAVTFTTYYITESSNELCIGRAQSSSYHNGPIDWAIQSVNDLTLEQITAYFSWTNKTSCRVVNYFGGIVWNSCVDRQNSCVDGQRPVCLDRALIPESLNGFVKEEYTSCLVYSIGIHDEWSFDEDMEKFGCHVYCFDPSMNSSNHNRTSQIHFYDLGLSNRDETWPDKTWAGSPIKNWTMTTLDSIYYNLLRHQGRIIDYLKIDIELSEWIVLPQILASGILDQVRQLGMEFHLFHPESEKIISLKEIRDRVNVIKSLEDYGLVRFDSVPSAWSEFECVVDGVDWIEYTAYDMAWYNPKLARN